MAADGLTEAQVRAIVREEWVKLEREKQAACDHVRSATLNPEAGTLACDDCNKELTIADR